MIALRRWLHNHGQHRFCHVVTRRVQTGTDFGPKYLVGSKVEPDGTITFQKVEITTFGGDPIYENREVHV